MSNAIHFTRFSGLDKPQGKSSTRSWADLVEMFKAAETYSDKKKMPLFSFTEFEGDYRAKKNAGMVHAIVVEHDGEVMDPAEAAKIMREHGIASIIYSTPSHTWDAPRWRLIAKLLRPVDEIEHGALVRIMNNLLNGAVAPESQHSEREWFFGRVEGAEYEFLSTDGYPLDTLIGMDIEPIERGFPSSDKKQTPARRETDAMSDALAWDVPTSEPPTEEAAERIRSMLDAAGHPDKLKDGRKRSRAQWLAMIAAVHSTQHPEAYNIALEWSKKGELFNPEDFERDWGSFKIDRYNTVKLGTLHMMATENGWIDPRSVIDPEDEILGEPGIGKRFANEYRGTFMYVESSDEWLRWTGHRWSRCTNGILMDSAHSLVRKVVSSALDEKNERGRDIDKTNYTQALSVYQKLHRIKAVVESAAGEPGMYVADTSQLDVDSMLLGVPNGVVDLKTGALLKAERSMLITRQAGASYEPDAKCPKFLNFMDEIFCGDQKMIDFVQRMYGYALTGLAHEHVFFFLHGAGSNGKSVLANLMADVFGEYGKSVDKSLIVRDRRGNSSDGERSKAQLPGVRMALINEVSTTDTFNDAAVKMVASTDPIVARYLNHEPFTFIPTHSVVMCGNHRPSSSDHGDGFWRRVVLIEFRRQFKINEIIKGLHSILFNEEAEGILAWIIRGCLAWQKNGLQVPQEVLDDIESYREDQDSLGDWIAINCVVDKTHKTFGSDLYRNYKEYMAKLDDDHAKGSKTLYRDLETRGFSSKKTMNGKLFFGISLKIINYDEVFKDADEDDGL